MKHRSWRTIFAVGIILLILIISVGWCGGFFVSYKKENYHYSIVVDPTNQSVNYTICLPLPLYKNGTIAVEVLEKMSLEGEGNYNVIDTKYGKALSITAQDKIKLNAQVTHDFILNKYIKLSMQNETYPEPDHGHILIYVYLNSTNESDVHVNLLCRSGHSIKERYDISSHSTSRIYKMDKTVKNGWQQVWVSCYWGGT